MRSRTDEVAMRFKAFCVLPVLLSYVALAGDSTPRLAVIRPAPSFTLVDQDEKPRNLEDYRGKVVLVSFIFTTCNGTCPATTHRMARVFHEVGKKEWKD